MPYRLSSNGLCVEQQSGDTWKSLKCYDNADDAKKYLAALQANVDDYDKGAKAMETTEQPQANVKMYWPEKLSQSEVSYESYMVRRNPVGQACANCRWFVAPMDCFIVKCEPLPILPTGWCDRWERMPAQEDEPVEVVIVEPPIGEDDSGEYEVGMMSRYGVDVAPPVVDQVGKRGLFQRNQVETSFKVLSSGRWIAFYTNNFEDSDDEILEGKSHKDYVARCKARLIELPELRRGHLDGTKHGQAVYVDYIQTDNVVTVFAIGMFDDTPAGKAAQRFYKKAKPGEISLSHGFVFPTWAKKNGKYKVYNTFEITTLRRGQEANSFTNINVKGKDMPLSAEQIKDIEAVFADQAPEMLKQIEARGKADKALADLGVKHKGVTDFADLNSTDEGAKALDAQTLSALKALLPTLLDDTAALSDGVLAMKAQLDIAVKARNADLEAKVASLEATVKGLQVYLETGERASESTKTVLDGKQLSPDMEKLVRDALEAKQSGNTEFDPFFGDLKVKKR